MDPQTRARLERNLVDSGCAPDSTVARLRTEPAIELPSLLIEEENADRTLVLQALSHAFGVPAVDLAQEAPDRALFEALPIELCVRSLALPLKVADGQVVVVIADPEDLAAVDAMRGALGRPVRIAVGIASEIRKRLAGSERGQDAQQAMADLLRDDEDEDEGAPPLRMSSRSEAVRPAVRLLDGIIQDAVERECATIYVLPYGKDEARVRFCVGQRVTEHMQFPVHMHAKLVNRLRLLCDLIGHDKRVPQTGCFQMLVRGQKHRIDVAILPSSEGEAVTIFIDQPASATLPAGRSKLCRQCREPMVAQWKYCPMCGTGA